MKKEDVKFYEPYELYTSQLEDILHLIQRILFLDLTKKSLKENDPYAKKLLKEEFFGSKLLLNIKRRLLKRQTFTEIDGLYYNCLSVYGVAPVHNGKNLYEPLAESIYSSHNLHILESFIAECRKKKKVEPPSVLLNRFQ